MKEVIEMTTKEKAFADEMVFLHFNSGETDLITQAALSMTYAGYELPDDKAETEVLAKELLLNEAISAYISEQKASFTLKLAPDNARARWQAIADMDV